MKCFPKFSVKHSGTLAQKRMFKARALYRESHIFINIPKFQTNMHAVFFIIIYECFNMIKADMLKLTHPENIENFYMTCKCV